MEQTFDKPLCRFLIHVPKKLDSFNREGIRLLYFPTQNACKIVLHFLSTFLASFGVEVVKPIIINFRIRGLALV